MFLPLGDLAAPNTRAVAKISSLLGIGNEQVGNGRELGSFFGFISLLLPMKVARGYTHSSQEISEHFTFFVHHCPLLLTVSVIFKV